MSNLGYGILIGILLCFLIPSASSYCRKEGKSFQHYSTKLKETYSSKAVCESKEKTYERKQRESRRNQDKLKRDEQRKIERKERQRRADERLEESRNRSRENKLKSKAAAACKREGEFYSFPGGDEYKDKNRCIEEYKNYHREWKTDL